MPRSADADSPVPTAQRRRVTFTATDLRLLALHLLLAGPAHGYGITRAIEGLTRGAYAPSPGVLYPLLARLRDEGLLDDAPAEGRRKRYAVSAAGRGALDAERDALDAAVRRATHLAQARDRVEVAPVRRAMAGLKLALNDRLPEGVDRETVLRVAALIDDATRAIERL